MKKKSKFKLIYLTLVMIVLYFPIFYLIYFSFSSGDSMSYFESFTFDHYQALLNDPRLIRIVLDTILLALLASLFATMIGTLGALYIHQVKKKSVRNSLLSLNNILLVSPDVIIGASFLILFTFAGFSLGFYSVLLSHIAFCVPIVVLMILPKLKEINPTLIDAAYDLGASKYKVLSAIILPLITPGILSGFFMALTYSLDDFAVTFFLTGQGFTTLSVEIFSRARRGISLEINALSTLMFLFSLLLVIGYYFLSRYNQNRKINNQKKKVTK